MATKWPVCGAVLRRIRPNAIRLLQLAILMILSKIIALRYSRTNCSNFKESFKYNGTLESSLERCPEVNWFALFQLIKHTRASIAIHCFFV